MKRRRAVAYLACSATPGLPLALAPEPVLTVCGRIGRTNTARTPAYDFTDAEFLALPPSSITTATAWTPRSVFVGPTLLEVMAAVGLTSGTLICKALDDKSAPIPWDDLVRYGVILAHSQNGKRLSIKRWGPLWTIYPRDRYPGALTGPTAESRFIWQVNRIEVRR